MRERRVRAWDKQEKIMYGPHQCGFYAGQPIILLGYKTFEWEGDSLAGKIIPINKRDRFVFMDYVGFNDREGSEIFEDDLVIVEGPNIYGVMKHIMTIPWPQLNNWTICGWYMRCIKGPWTGKIQPLDTNVKVIGNIYENPEDEEKV